ncbi:hypothetical protein [Geminicoccus flavidas]|uniref:hypothetical protein n=1 Tax=Geminicoccus flavidas TaxID=2506407 RepID=UPI001359B11B|nr:hypothetical protein [Geminicoccus flavidas]
MRMIYRAALASVFLAAAVPAHAANGRLVPMGGMSVVIVWKDADAHSKGLRLIQSGAAEAKPELLSPLIACLVEPNAKAITTDAGFATHDIMVVDGEHAGCEGNVATEAFELVRD